MKTTLGMFPIQGTMSIETLDYISVACSMLILDQLDESKLSSKQKATREGISQLYLDAVSDDPANKSKEIFKNNFFLYNKEALEDLSNTDTFLPSTYFDEEEGRVRKISDVGYNEPVVKLFKEHYYNNLYGESYKSREVNIAFEERKDEDWNESDKYTISPAEVMSNVQNKDDTTIDFNSDIEVEESINEMNQLQEYFLINERVDFRELLINYFQMNTNPELVISQSKEVLEELIDKHRNKVSDTLSHYLMLRQDGRIPEEYMSKLF